MATYSRGCNPLWSFVNTTGGQLDDTYYIFFLQPDLPYLPKAVYMNSDGTGAWSTPIPISAAGTLPLNVYGEEGAEYRIEIRQGPSQSDALIWLWEDWIWPSDTSGGGGGGTIDLLSENQLTNPQFVLSYVETTVTFTAAGTYPLAPGWDVVLTGSGSLTVTYASKAGTDYTSLEPVPPYTFQFTGSSGFSAIQLRQRLDGNGGIWSLGAAAFTGTFYSSTGANVIQVTYEPSTGSAVELMSELPPSGVYSVLQGANDIPQSTNSTTNEDAYVDIIINIPPEDTIALGSLQLLGQEEPLQTDFQQETVERQTDHMFNVYKDSILIMPKQSILAGWQFANNPWQYISTGSTVLGNQTDYTADQTIVHQQAGTSHVATSRGTAANNYGLTITAITKTSQFALIQYIDPATMRGYWGRKLSSLVKCRLNSPSHGSNIRLKARLIYRSSLPPTIGAAEPIATWSSGGNPSFAMGWTAVAPLNDPAFTLESSSTLEFLWHGMESVASDNDDMTLGIVIYTIDNMNSDATADNIIFDDISLVPNDFALESPSLTYEETLRRCQFYYEMSYLTYAEVGTATDVNCKNYSSVVENHNALYARPSFELEYTVQKRGAPTLTFYELQSGTKDEITTAVLIAAGALTQSNKAITNWLEISNDVRRAFYTWKGGSSMGVQLAVLTRFHYLADSRLGV